MSAKGSTVVKLPTINKQILELKKKIQLSEGQRKALYNDCEKERKQNSDLIITLKKDISKLIVSLKNSKNCLNYKPQKVQISSMLEKVIGHLGDKTASELIEVLDLQVIDKCKLLNLLKYKSEKREEYLAQLGDEYQTLLSKKVEKETIEKIDKPIKKKLKEIENDINAVEVQYREALHVRKRYQIIEKSLKDDSSKYEANIKSIQEEIDLQELDVEKLQKTNNEAARMRSSARGSLIQEERNAVSASTSRGRQADDCKQLVTNNKHQLEQLEKRLFHTTRNTTKEGGGGGGQSTTITNNKVVASVIVVTPSPSTGGLMTGGGGGRRQPPDGAEIDEEEEGDVGEGDYTTTALQHPVEELVEAFEVLKAATGATNVDEVLQRFRGQKNTIARLALMRKNSELRKKELETELAESNLELEKLKFAEERDAEQNIEEIEAVNTEISYEKTRQKNLFESRRKNRHVFERIVEKLEAIYLNLNPYTKGDNDFEMLIEKIGNHLEEAMAIKEIEIGNNSENEEEEINEEKWLPPPYSGLVRRTPMLQQGSPTTPVPPQVSEDEDEVPSRGFLKRQAQLVIDAKSRRKTMKLIQRK